MFVCTTTTVSFSPNMWAKRFLTTWVTLSRHLNLKFPHRYDSDGASVSEVKNLENHNLIEGLVFKFPVHFTARQEFFKTPFAVQNDGNSVSGFGPDTPPFSDLTGCLKKIGRRTLVRNLLR